MAITPLPTPPSRSDPANFAARGDAFVAALETLVTEINAQIEEGLNGAVSATTLSVSGLLSLNSGKMKFPSSQAASTDPNTLDDYEEGTFTPSFGFSVTSSGVTYAVRTGFYTKIGNRAIANLQIGLSSKGSASGTVTITGLPFASKNVSGQYSVPSVRASAMAAGIANVQCYVAPSESAIRLDKFAAGATAVVTEADLQDSTALLLTVPYLTA